jgi:hypothetical protein
LLLLLLLLPLLLEPDDDLILLLSFDEYDDEALSFSFASSCSAASNSGGFVQALTLVFEL